MMTKQEFLQGLETRLQQENIANVDSVLDFYDEMISDRMEEGMSEEDAVAKNEDIESIVNSMNLEKSMPNLIKDTIAKKHDNAKKNNKSASWTVLLVIGAPIWIPLALAYMAVVFSFILCIFSLLLAYFAIALSFSVSSILYFIGAFTVFIGNVTFAGCVFMIGTSLLLGGISVFMWIGAKSVTREILDFTKTILRKAKGGILCVNR